MWPQLLSLCFQLSGSKLESTPLDVKQKELEDFYMTDPISRASSTMAKCVQAVVKQKQSKYFEAANAQNVASALVPHSLSHRGRTVCSWVCRFRHRLYNQVRETLFLFDSSHPLDICKPPYSTTSQHLHILILYLLCIENCRQK